MTDLRTYDPLKVVGSWSTTSTLGTIDILDGAIDGDFASITRDNARWTREHDRAGNSTRVRNNNRGGTISVTIDASSPTNARLSRAVQEDDLGESVVGTLLLRDLNGDTIIEADGAFVEDIPDLSFGNSSGTRVWVFQCANIRKFVGGRELA